MNPRAAVSSGGPDVRILFIHIHQEDAMAIRHYPRILFRLGSARALTRAMDHGLLAETNSSRRWTM